MEKKTRKYNGRKKWTAEEIQTLLKLAENFTQSQIAKKMKRPKSSIKGKMYELGLGCLADRTDMWTFAEVAEVIGCDRGSIGKTWVAHGLLYYKRGAYRLVREQNLIKFMQEHPNLWDATKCDPYIFGQYDWFQAKLQDDKNRKGYTYWTDYEKQRVLMLIRQGKTQNEIAGIVGRSRSSISHMVMRIKREDNYKQRWN